MSAPFKTPKKNVVIAGKPNAVPVGPEAIDMIKKDSRDFQKKMFGESCKKLIEGFVNGHIKLDYFLSQMGMFSEAFCEAVGRSDELAFLDLTEEMEEDFEEDDDDFYEKEYPASQFQD